MRATAPLALAAALCACTDTGAGVDPLIPNESVARAVRLTALGTLAGSELGLVVAAPPEGFNTCPSVAQDGDAWTFDYGGGCVPDSGITTELVTGTLELTIAAGSRAFFGTIAGFGVAPASLSGSVSGSASSAGDLYSVDVEVSEGTYAQDEVDITVDAFFELTGDQEAVSVFVDAGTFVGSTPPATRFDAGAASVPRDALASCFVPAGGTLTLFKDRGRADVTFSPDANASGNVTANFNDRDPATVRPCG